MDMDTLLYILYKEKGIKSEIKFVEELREYQIEFSKDNRHFTKRIPLDGIYPHISFTDAYLYNLKKEAETELDH